MKTAERKCPMQRGMMVSVKWCLDAQRRDYCGEMLGGGKKAHTCPYNKNFEVSEYQKNKRQGKVKE